MEVRGGVRVQGIGQCAVRGSGGEKPAAPGRGAIDANAKRGTTAEIIGAAER